MPCGRVGCSQLLQQPPPWVDVEKSAGHDISKGATWRVALPKMCSGASSSLFRRLSSSHRTYSSLSSPGSLRCPEYRCGHKFAVAAEPAAGAPLRDPLRPVFNATACRLFRKAPWAYVPRGVPATGGARGGASRAAE